MAKLDLLSTPLPSLSLLPEKLFALPYNVYDFSDFKYSSHKNINQKAPCVCISAVLLLRLPIYDNLVVVFIIIIKVGCRKDVCKKIIKNAYATLSQHFIEKKERKVLQVTSPFNSSLFNDTKSNY